MWVPQSACQTMMEESKVVRFPCPMALLWANPTKMEALSDDLLEQHCAKETQIPVSLVLSLLVEHHSRLVLMMASLRGLLAALLAEVLWAQRQDLYNNQHPAFLILHSPALQYSHFADDIPGPLCNHRQYHSHLHRAHSYLVPCCCQHEKESMAFVQYNSHHLRCLHLDTQEQFVFDRFDGNTQGLPCIVHLHHNPLRIHPIE
mmetsp:Transcript_45881/g.96344  ORF Transcript_45881/g.96344 Transcript_45881/m.96344 type:complete len:203 (-) Transcript_45881:134-742(-)